MPSTPLARRPSGVASHFIHAAPRCTVVLPSGACPNDLGNYAVLRLEGSGRVVKSRSTLDAVMSSLDLVIGPNGNALASSE